MKNKSSSEGTRFEELYKIVEDLRSRLEITEVLHQYARAFDRFDTEEARACFCPDSIITFAGFDGLAYDFIDEGLESIRRFKSVTHHISNVSIVLDGARAATECYYFAHQRKPISGNEIEDEDLFLMGRYIDEFSFTPKGWKIRKRIGLQDCLRILSPADKTFDSVPIEYTSRRSPHDPFLVLKKRLST